MVKHGKALGRKPATFYDAFLADGENLKGFYHQVAQIVREFLAYGLNFTF
jgi:hypothetical protein